MNEQRESRRWPWLHASLHPEILRRGTALRILVGLSFAFAGISVARSSAAQDAASPCGAVTAHRKDTVIVFEAPSTFTICRDGGTETDVVTGRPVYLDLLPTPSANMFEFRIHG